MDQVRKILGWLKQQHFWVLSGLVAVIAIFCWWSASGTLISEFQSNKQAIDTEFASLESLQNKPFHPNDGIIERQKEEATKQANHVRETWQKLYDRQRENVLEWPDDLSPEFLKHIETLKFGDEIPRDLRNNYQNYARRYFPELPKIVGARELPEGQGAAGYGGETLGGRGVGGYGGYGGESGGNLLGAGGEPLEDDGSYICQWLDQGGVREALRFPQRPASIRIWVTQEDLWVYKALLTAIRKTNEAAGATRMSNAAIRIIYQLQVGKTAAPFSRQKDRVYMVPSAAPAGGDAMLGAEGGAMMEGGERGIGGDPYGGGTSGYGGYGGETTGRLGMGEGGYGTTGGGAMTEEQEKAFLTAGRYLDEQGKPIGGAAPAATDAMTDPLAAEPAADLGSFGTEYKRLPVRMVLQIDQRWLTRLISECANQPLQIEVREVRINPQGVSGEGGGGMLGGGYGGGYGGRGEGGGGMAGSMFPELTGIQTFPAQPNIIDVEIQGIIYIFNEPNPTVLQVTDEPAVTASL